MPDFVPERELAGSGDAPVGAGDRASPRVMPSWPARPKALMPKTMTKLTALGSRMQLGVGTAVAFELGFDPIEGGAVAIGALAAVAEFGERFDGGLVGIEVEAGGDGGDGVGRGRRGFLSERDGAEGK